MYKEVFSSWIYHSDHSDKFEYAPVASFQFDDLCQQKKGLKKKDREREERILKKTLKIFGMV